MDYFKPFTLKITVFLLGIVPYYFFQFFEIKRAFTDVEKIAGFREACWCSAFRSIRGFLGSPIYVFSQKQTNP
jgi:hypothetical protein